MKITERITKIDRYGLDKTGVVLCLSLGVLVCVRHIVGISIPLPLLSLVSVAVLSAAWSGRVMVNIPLAALVAVYGIGILIHPYPEPWLRSMRFMAFIIGLACFSPLLMSEKLGICRALAAKTMLVTMAVMVFLSFLVWLFCLAVIGNEGIISTRFHYYGFRGVFIMGMTLSPAAAIVAIAAISKLTDGGSRRQAVVSACLFVVGVIMCLAGGSRIALAGLCASLALLAFRRRHALAALFKKPAVRVASLCMLLVIVISLPAAMSMINLKNRVAKSHGSLMYSHRTLWENRVEECRSSPIIGIGYANEFPSTQNGGGDLSRIEPGSSWLSLISYGGVVGAGTFLVFLMLLIKRMLRARSDRRFTLYSSLLLFFLINGISEGWLLFAGSMISPLFWMTTSALWEMGQKRDGNRHESLGIVCHDHEGKGY